MPVLYSMADLSQTTLEAGHSKPFSSQIVKDIMRRNTLLTTGRLEKENLFHSEESSKIQP